MLMSIKKELLSSLRNENIIDLSPLAHNCVTTRKLESASNRQLKTLYTDFQHAFYCISFCKQSDFTSAINGTHFVVIIILHQHLSRFAWSAKSSCYKLRTCVQRKVVKYIIYNHKTFLKVKIKVVTSLLESHNWVLGFHFVRQSVVDFYALICKCFSGGFCSYTRNHEIAFVTSSVLMMVQPFKTFLEHPWRKTV